MREAPAALQQHPTAMNSGAGGSGNQSQHPSPPVCAPHAHAALPPRSSAATTHARYSTICTVASVPPGFDAGLKLLHRSWADLLPDILGVVAGRLARAEDRARMRAVCRAWLAAARVYGRLPPPLPLLVLHDFGFSSFCSDGVMTGMRRIPLPLDGEGRGVVRCVGSYEGWLVGVQPYEGLGDGLCFLMKAFSLDIIHLPPPSPEPDSNSFSALSSADGHTRYFTVTDGSNSVTAYAIVANSVNVCTRSLPVINGFGQVLFIVHGPQCAMSFRKVVLSSAPDSGSKFVVAALSATNIVAPMLALWTPGMSSWCVCLGNWFSRFSDIAFYQGKLYLLSEFAFELISIEISEDGDRGLMVSRVEICETDGLPWINGSSILRRWNIAECDGKLLLILRYLGGSSECLESIREVRVFEVDLSANPVRFNKINSLGGDCIFISQCSSGTFHVGQYDGVEDDLVYFIDGRFPSNDNGAPAFVNFVYNMRDGTVAPFAAGILEEYLQLPKGRPMNPTWLFPSE